MPTVVPHVDPEAVCNSITWGDVRRRLLVRMAPAEVSHVLLMQSRSLTIFSDAGGSTDTAHDQRCHEGTLVDKTHTLRFEFTA